MDALAGVGPSRVARPLWREPARAPPALHGLWLPRRVRAPFRRAVDGETPERARHTLRVRGVRRWAHGRAVSLRCLAAQARPRAGPRREERNDQGGENETRLSLSDVFERD